MAPLGPYASTAFFGIFDGHGDGGEKPAAYAAQRVGAHSFCTPGYFPMAARPRSGCHACACSRTLDQRLCEGPSLPGFWLAAVLCTIIVWQLQLT